MWGWKKPSFYTYPSTASEPWFGASGRCGVDTEQHWFFHWSLGGESLCGSLCRWDWLCRHQSCSSPLRLVPCKLTGLWKQIKALWNHILLLNACCFTHGGNSPSTLQTYDFRTCLVLICCSISRAFLGLRPNRSSPEVSLSRRWMVRRFLSPYSLARMKTTVLWR